MNEDDEDQKARRVPDRKPKGGPLVPDSMNRGPVGNMLGRMHARDQTKSLEVDTALKKAFSENFRATQETLDEYQKLKIAAELANQETPAIIEAKLAAARREREAQERQQLIEEAKSRADLADVNERVKRSHDRRKLNDETMMLRAQLNKAKAELDLKIKLSTDEERQRARIKAEIDAIEKGDFTKLRALQMLDRQLSDRAGTVDDDRDPEENAEDLEVQLAVVKRLLKEAITRGEDTNQLARERDRLEDEIQKAQAGDQIA